MSRLLSCSGVTQKANPLLRRHTSVSVKLDADKLTTILSVSRQCTVPSSLFKFDSLSEWHCLTELENTLANDLMQYDSFVPMSYKKSLINGLIHRAWKIRSSEELFQTELTNIKHLLLSNGYSSKLINRQSKLFLYKQLAVEPKDIEFGPEKRSVYISLPFSGTNSFKLGRQLNRLITKIAPGIDLNIVFEATNRLKALSMLKSPIPTLNKSNVIYQINCLRCQEFYIGLTTRRLCKRIYEHKKRNYSANL